jgi:C4-dicarboxylate transporter, DctM subunit
MIDPPEPTARDVAKAEPAVSLESPGWIKGFVAGENLLVIFSLAVLVLLPLVEMILRKLKLQGISGTSAFVQHFTLILGMLGGAIAARQGRLLALSTLATFLKGWAKSVAAIYSNGWAAAVSVFLCLASVRFLQAEKLGGKILAYGIPIWVIQLILPLGFGLVALRLIWGPSATSKERLATLLLAGGIVWIGVGSPFDPENMIWPGLAAALLAAVLGAPIFAVIGGVSLVLLWGNQYPVAAIPLKHYSLVTAPALPTIPLFTLAGYFLAEGGASKRVVRVFQAFVGRIRGGPAIVTALVCAYFTSFTGASGVTILALGGLLMPVLVSANYSERNALGLLTGAGSLGVLLPPCLPLILYSIVAGGVVANLDVASVDAAGLTMEKMFLGGVLPGILLIGLTAWLGVRQGPRIESTGKWIEWKEARQAVWEAKWEMLLPVVALAALFGGWATPVQAAALTAFYAFFVESVVYRDLKSLKSIGKVMTECGLLVGGVLLILGVAMGFTNYLVTEQVPDLVVDWVKRSIHSPWVFLLVLNFVLLVVGCLMDIFSAIVVVVPLIVPLGVAFGIDPIHLGIIFLANLQLGYLTPPVGMNLFLASYRFNKPMTEVIRASLPMFLILLIGVLIITYVPFLSTFLPACFK